MVPSLLFHEYFGTQPKGTEMFRNSSSVWLAFFPRAEQRAAASKNRLSGPGH